MSFGITPQGFNIKRLTDIKQSIEERVVDLLGPLDQSASSLLGNYNSVISESLSNLWEALEDVYYSQYPNSAEGVSLDNVVIINRLRRLQSDESEVTALLCGEEGTLIPALTQVSVVQTDEIFETEIDKTITESEVLQARVVVQNVVNSFLYQIGIDSTFYEYTSDSSATEQEILDGLVIAINASSQVEAVLDETTIVVTAIDRVTTFWIQTSTNLLFEQLCTPVNAMAINKGPITVPIGTLTQIVSSPIIGFDGVNNLTEGIRGRDVETDAELRIRREDSIQIQGAATLGAILSRLLQEVEGVSSVIVLENPYDVIDGDGRPPHSFEVIVDGGEQVLIAQKILEVKAVGIQTHGDITEIIDDSQGIPKEIKFSRPVTKYAHFRIDLTLSAEEEFPIDGETQIKTNIVQLGETFTIGDDFILKKFYEPVFRPGGVADADIEIAITDNPLDVPTYQTTNISIDFNEILNFSEDRISYI